LAELSVVTGAFSFTGRYVAEELLARGARVRTLSRSPAPPGSRIESAPLAFGDRAALVESLRGADALYNTYWIRFPHGGSTFERAVENTRTLLRAAREAGVRRLVHVSVTNASEASPLPYFRGKGILEREVRESGLSYAIVRPTLVFGSDDILVNNIAWILRRLPAFVLAGRGDYAVQPVSAADVARLAVDAGEAAGDTSFDTVGPERYAFEELVRSIAAAIGRRARIVHAPPAVVLALGALVGRARGDVVLTREELEGLMLSLLVSHGPVTGRDSFREWVGANADSLGRRYVSELARNYRHAPL
jgi:NADH dehydrogenase